MCNKCFLEGIYRFDKMVDFNSFEEELLALLSTEGGLSRLDNDIKYRNLPLQTLECSSCKAIWYLSLPVTNSIRPNWHGFFLQKDEAEPYFDTLILRARKKAFLLGSISVSVLILMLLIHALYFR